MKYLKQVERSATVAFCPHSHIVAAGTVAGAIDISFSTNSVLEIYGLDYSTHTDSPPLLGSVNAPERFNRLAWGPRFQDSGTQQLGIIAGGLADGSVCLWDPAIVLDKAAKAEHKTPLLAKMQKHTGAVKGLEFNAFSPNLLASGAADSDLCIWDLTKPATPSLYPALKGGAGSPAAGSEVTFIAWNRKVQHILASTNSNGTTVVWDLKRQKPVISFRDTSSQRRASVLQWNPEIATQLIVASDDDRSPTLQMWDLRNSVSPLKEFLGHTKGVLGMAWSAHDPSLLLSTAKDNRTICWDVGTTEVVCELSTGHNWNFDVQWSPLTPGVFSTASFEGHVELYSLTSCTGSKTMETVHDDFSVTQHSSGDTVPLKKAPAWMRRPVSATFGFGGKLVSVTNQRTQVADASGQLRVQHSGRVSLSQVITEHELVAKSQGFEAAIEGGNPATLRDYCASKKTSTDISPQEAETWAVLSILFEGEEARRALLAHLGFTDLPERPLANGGMDGGANGLSNGGGVDVNGISCAVHQLDFEGKAISDLASPSGMGEFSADDPSFFDNLDDSQAFSAQEPAHAGPEGVSPSAAGRLQAGVSNAASDMDRLSEAGAAAVSSEHEPEINAALIVGNYAAAVEHCFAAHRYADALLIANTAGKALYQQTMHRYMRKAPRPYQAIIVASIEGDYAGLVKSRPVGQWRETLALLATYTDRDTFRTLADQLATRLASAGMQHEASLCWVCGGHTDHAVAYWSKKTSGSSTSVDVMQNVIEKAVIMGMAPGVSAPAASQASSSGGVNKASPSLSELVTSYASLLAAQGRMAMALDYLDHVPGEASTAVALLKDRIYRSGAPDIPAGMHAPPFPFIREEVAVVAKGAGSAAAAASTVSAQAGYAASYGYGAQTAAPAAPATNVYNTYGNQHSQAYANPAQAAYAPAAAAQPQQGPAYGAAQNQYGGAAAQQQQPAQQYAAHNAAAPVAQQQPQYVNQQPQYGAQPLNNTYSAYSTAPASGYAAQPHTSDYSRQQEAAGNATAAYNQSFSTSQAFAPMYQEPPAAVYNPKRSAPVSTAPPPAAFTPAAVAAPVAPQPQPQPSYAPPTASAGAGNAAYPPATAMQPQPHHAQQPYQPQPPQQHMPMPAAPQQTVQAPSFFAPATAVAPVAPASAYAAAPGPPPGMPAGSAHMAPVPASQPARPQPPAPPPGPPANVSITNVDTSAVPADAKPIVVSLVTLFESCLPLANNPAKKREMDDNNKKLGQLLWKLNAGDVSAGVVPKLLQLCQAIDAKDWHTANHYQVLMTTSDWDECGFWLSALKRLIKTRQTAG